MDFKVGDFVKVLPNKKQGFITKIENNFWIFLNNENRPYMPEQIELVRK